MDYSIIALNPDPTVSFGINKWTGILLIFPRAHDMWKSKMDYSIIPLNPDPTVNLSIDEWKNDFRLTGIIIIRMRSEVYS